MKFAEAEADELAFVFDSWARSFQKSPYAGCIPNHMYPQVSRAAAAEIIDRGARVLVAYADMEDGSRRIMGYSVSEPEKQTLHWLFVKHDYRGLGVGTALLNETCATWKAPSYTYRTKASAKFLGPTFRWEPRFARIKA